MIHLREDYRVSIDAIVFKGTCSDELIAEFQNFVGSADELIITCTCNNFYVSIFNTPLT